MKKFFPGLVVLIFLYTSCTQNTDIKYSVADVPWIESNGNHRAILKVEKAAGAVELNLLWRRHDKNPGDKRLMIIHAETGDTIPNIIRKEVSNENCSIVFGPVTSPGKYYFYYLPYAVQPEYGFYYKGHLIPEDEPDKEWLERNIPSDNVKEPQLEQAKCLGIEARTDFDSFYPMEVIATEKEKKEFINQTGSEYYIFPESRLNPIRMLDNIPFRWIKEKTGGGFIGEALKNEYYVFQLGLWAATKDLKNISIEFSSLNNGSNIIEADKITSFNTEGYDPDGNYFEKVVNVGREKVQPLWIGVDIPKKTPAGKYKGKITINSESSNEKEIDIVIKVKNEVLDDRGDSELWRHSRLRWLNSSAGLNREAVSSHNPIQIDSDGTVKILGRKIMLGELGLPEQITAWGNPILTGPVSFEIISESGSRISKKSKSTKTGQHSGEISWDHSTENDYYSIHGSSEIESDGYIHYQYTIKAKQDLSLSNIKLTIPFRSEIAEYMMGMGLPGTLVPESHKAKWEGPHDSFWIGNTYGGIHCELRGTSYSGPLLNLYKPEPPDSWHNNGKGGFGISRIGNTVKATVSSGSRELMSGEELIFEFAFIITPVKEIDTKSQFTDRYYHNGSDPAPDDDELEAGVRIINLHHANEFNPHINYPFIANDEMKGFVDRYHSQGKKVKIYYTIRELTNWVTEIWALRSLGDEILGNGPAGGFPWLREHFLDNYTPQWYHRLDSLKVDASVLTSTGESRWFNYYIEGLGWLVENMDIDGLYLDDVSFDRKMMKRMRKVMEERKPGCILDLHSNTGFSKGPAVQYTDFFPYVDKLWFGESFQYDKMPPENWLVEVSGIPFGLMGDMLHGGGNPWRGMIYGMTVRYPWTTEGVTCNPRDIWRLWDEFEIASAEMTGYWDKGSEIRTNSKDVLLTYYTHPDKILISIASWSDKTEHIRIIADWKSMGFDMNTSRFNAPGIENFQSESLFHPNDPISVDPGKGCLLIINK